jgi:hypothetical protein
MDEVGPGTIVQHGIQPASTLKSMDRFIQRCQASRQPNSGSRLPTGDIANGQCALAPIGARQYRGVGVCVIAHDLQPRSFL